MGHRIDSDSGGMLDLVVVLVAIYGEDSSILEKRAASWY